MNDHFKACLYVQHDGSVADQEAHERTWTGAIGCALMAVALSDHPDLTPDLRRSLMRAINKRREREPLEAEIAQIPSQEK